MAQAAERVVMPARSLGRVRGPLGAVGLVVEGFWTWYRKNWRASVVTMVVQPVLFLIAMGFGFGSQVEPGPATGGLRYVVYLAPALLVASTVNTAVFESTYPVLSGFKWQQVYVAMSTSPLTAAQVAVGQLAWVALRLAGAGLVYLTVAAVLGVLTGPATLLALVAAVLTGMACSAPVVAYSATLDSDRPYSGLFRFIVLPMALFAGTFFPVDNLPVVLRVVAWITPMWHGTELARGWAFGGLDPWPAAGHLAYLSVMIAIGTWLSARYFRARLAP